MALIIDSNLEAYAMALANNTMAEDEVTREEMAKSTAGFKMRMSEHLANDTTGEVSKMIEFHDSQHTMLQEDLDRDEVIRVSSNLTNEISDTLDVKSSGHIHKMTEDDFTTESSVMMTHIQNNPTLLNKVNLGVIPMPFDDLLPEELTDYPTTLDDNITYLRTFDSVPVEDNPYSNEYFSGVYVASTSDAYEMISDEEQGLLLDLDSTIRSKIKNRSKF